MCSGTATTMETKPQTMTTMQTNMAKVVITVNGAGGLVIVRTPEDDGAPRSCTEPATLAKDGMSATLDTPLMCPTATATIVETITASTLTIGANDTTYTATSTYTLSGTTLAGKPYAATGTGSSTCTKM
jgi:hypothetical protein